MPVSSALEQSAPMGASDLKSQWLKCHMLSKAECIQWERVDFRCLPASLESLHRALPCKVAIQQ